MRLPAAVLAVLLALAGCTGSGGGSTASGECLDDVLAAYRSLAPPAESLAAGYGSISAATGEERRDGERVRAALRETRAAARAYEAAARSAERVTAACADDPGVAASCRAALEQLGAVLRSADAPAARSVGRAGIERAAAALEERQVRLEGAAAATASCG